MLIFNPKSSDEQIRKDGSQLVWGSIILIVLTLMGFGCPPLWILVVYGVRHLLMRANRE